MTDYIEQLVDLIEKAAEEKKAADIVILNIGKVSVVADYFIIATGSSKVQVQAIADNITDSLRIEGFPTLHEEGLNEGLWVLLDYGAVVVHIFQPEERSFYNLERLWNHAPRTANNSLAH